MCDRGVILQTVQAGLSYWLAITGTRFFSQVKPDDDGLHYATSVFWHDNVDVCEVNTVGTWDSVAQTQFIETGRFWPEVQVCVDRTFIYCVVEHALVHLAVFYAPMYGTGGYPCTPFFVSREECAPATFLEGERGDFFRRV